MVLCSFFVVFFFVSVVIEMGMVVMDDGVIGYWIVHEFSFVKKWLVC